MKNKLRFFKKNKQGIIALLVLLIMLFNACDISGNNTSNNALTPMGFYLDSSGNFSETDSGRTVVVADDKTKVVFYSDNIASNTQRVGFAFEDKTIIFLFEKNQNFPTRLVLSDSEDTYKGVFTSYDSVTQTYSLTLDQDGDKEILTNIALSKDIFTQYKDDLSLTSSQNLRIRNLYIATCIYKSLNDYISSESSHQARKGIGDFFKKVGKFFSGPVAKIALGVAATIVGGFLVVAGTMTFFEGGAALIIEGAPWLLDGILMTIDGIKQASSGGGGGGGGGSGGSSSGGGGGGANTPTTVAVTDVSLNKSSVNLIVGNVETLVSTITPANATNKAVSWSSSNPAVAKVSSHGTVTSLSIGTATITVTTSDGSKTASCIINVNPVPVTGVSLNKATTAMVVNGTETLFAEIDPPNATNKSVTWRSDNTAVATVSTTGKVSAVSVGSATITVATVDGNKTAVCNVTVVTSAVAVTEVSLNKSSTSLDVGGTETLVATISPSSATDQNVTWYSNNTSVATVSANGTVTALTAGTATITVVTADGSKTASCVVTVISWDVYDESTWNEVINRIKNGGNNNTYTITVTGNFSIPGVSANTFGSVTGITVTITGDKVISLATGSIGNLLCIGSKQTVIIRDLGLKGHSTNNDSLVYCEANFTMQGNATVSGNTASFNGGGVYVGTSGTFTMQNNATVSGNTASNNGGGVVVFRSGTFTMQDNATVSGNTAGSGGGVGVFPNGTFTMHDNATVSGNTASVYGGGVDVNGTFIIGGGTVYGNEGMPLGNSSGFFGAALCVWSYENDIGTAKYGDGNNISLLPSTNGLFEYSNNTIIGR